VAVDNPLSLLGKFIPDLRPGYVREFHDAVKAAIADGKLSEQEIAQLEQKREELGIGEDALSGKIKNGSAESDLGVGLPCIVLALLLALFGFFRVSRHIHGGK
jgi:hypothetical protein